MTGGCSRGCCASQAEHFRSLQVQRPQAADRRRSDFALSADLAAYRALRRQGFQPPRVDGSYDLTRRATTEAEIRLGQVIADGDYAVRRRGGALMSAMTEISDTAMTGEVPEKGAGRKRLPMREKRPHDHG